LISPGFRRRSGEWWKVIVDGRDVPTGTVVSVDLCIIGGGPAGISLALQFANQARITVALVESGGREWDERTQELSEADSVGHAYFPVKETHLRVLGGSTLSYGGICTEMSDLDFEQRSWVPESGWPLGKSALDPYLPKARELLGVPDEAAPGAGWDSTDATVWEPVRVSDPPTRFGRKYAPELEKASNVTTYLHSTVTNLALHPDGGHIAGVTVRSFGGNHFRIEASSYVLAGGGVETPRLLLASNDVATAGIGNQYDNVGRYFQEHLRATDRYLIPAGLKAQTEQITGAAGTLHFSRLALTDETMRREQLLNYYANVTFGFSGQDSAQWSAIRRIVVAYKRPWNDSPYFQGAGGGRTKIYWEDVRTALVKPHRTIQSLAGAALRPTFMRRWVELGSSIEQVPRRENRVTLVSDKDELGMPRIELHWSLDDREKDTYLRGRKIILEELDRHLAGLSANAKDDQEQWPDSIIGTWHHAGTTRMHDDRKKGVVDTDARVHGINNLYIASSSIFPTSGATSPTQAIVCLTLKLADHLKNLQRS
jgi:choline dehydrogenase-like flavoprotein